MARSRSIKPSFFCNEYLAELEPLARLLFIGLWCIADRDGRLEDRPKKIKAQILPYDNCDVDKLLCELANSKEQFIIRYSVDGSNYIEITNFKTHQNPHIKELSTCPALDLHQISTKLALNLHQLDTEQGSESSNRKEVIGNRDKVIGKRKEVKSNRETEIPFKEIIDYLNMRAGTNYKSTTQKTRESIIARFNENRKEEEKYTLQDFYDVIDKKCVEWVGTTREMYLRPQTLFGTNFESYLNQKITKKLSDMERLKKAYQEAENEQN